MRRYAAILLLLALPQAPVRPFTLQTYAKVNIVPAVRIQREPDPDEFLRVSSAAGDAEPAGPGLTFTIANPAHLWAHVTLVDLAEDILPRQISVRCGSAAQIVVSHPMPPLAAGRQPSRASLLLRVEYE